MDLLSETQRANIEYHTLLAPQYEQQPFFQEANRKRVRAKLSELAESTPGERLLDIGCGTGLVLDLTHDLFKQLDGIDITSEMIARVKPRPNVTTQLASAEKIPFPDSTFDAVTAYSVLHHIEDVSKVFREVRRALKSGGFFYADESPSEDYLDAFLALDPNSSMADSVKRERDKIIHDAAEYQKKYGLPADLAQRAMVQNYSRHSLRQENLERSLKDAGFDDVQITFRRFVGEDQCRAEGGEEKVHALQSYLVSMLPLTRNLFKYFVLVAR